MSQYRSNTSAGLDVLYGFDNTLGYWLDIYRNIRDDIPIEQHSTRFDPTFTGAAMVRFVDENGISVPPAHRRAMLWDLPF